MGDITESVRDDIATELRDWATITDETQGKAMLVMLSGSIFSEAADEIERLREQQNQWQATAAGLSQDLSNAEDEIERLSESLHNALRLLAARKENQDD